MRRTAARPMPQSLSEQIPSEPVQAFGTPVEITEAEAATLAAEIAQLPELATMTLTDPKTGLPWRYPNPHCLLYGEGASGKTSFIAQYMLRLHQDHGLPSLVLAFDPPGKMWPYYELGEAVPCEEPFYQQWGIPVTDVLDPEGNLIVRLEQYAEPENINLAQAAGMQANPKAWMNFNARLASFGLEAPNYGAVALDSMTGLIYANMCLQRVVKPMQAFASGTDTRQWYSMATDDVEGLLKSRLPWWQTAVFVSCHVAEDKNKEEYAEGKLRGVSLIGRLSGNAIQCYEEMWRMVVVPDLQKPGQYRRELQTRSSTLYSATSLILKAPNPCLPDYDALWSNYRNKKLGLVEEHVAAPSVTTPARRRRR